MSVSYVNLGYLLESNGNREQATEHYEKGLEINARIVALTPNDLQSLRGLCVSYDRLGDLSKEGGDCSRARKYYERALWARNEIFERPQTTLCCCATCALPMIDWAICRKMKENVQKRWNTMKKR